MNWWSRVWRRWRDSTKIAAVNTNDVAPPIISDPHLAWGRPTVTFFCTSRFCSCYCVVFIFFYLVNVVQRVYIAAALAGVRLLHIGRCCICPRWVVVFRLILGIRPVAFGVSRGGSGSGVVRLDWRPSRQDLFAIASRNSRSRDLSAALL